jgi:hypothetical protein
MKRNKSILLIGDSQPLPRYIGNTKVNYYETFLYKLKKKYKNYDILEIIIGGAKFSQLLGQAAPYYGRSKPNFVIIFGTNMDARVRGISYFEEKLLNLFPFGYLISKALIQNNFLQKIRNIKNTDTKTFDKQVKYCLNLFKDSKILWIEMYISNQFRLKNKKLSENISIFNKIIKNNLKKNNIFVKVEKELRKNKSFTNDGIHINHIGHQTIYNIINKKILELSIDKT